MRAFPFRLLWLVCLLVVGIVHAESNVPTPLEPWRAWVLKGQEFRACPPRRQCAPVAYAISLPLWVYKLAMLAWALWLANALVGWLRVGFAAWTQGGYWRSTLRPVIDVPTMDAPAPPAQP